MPTPIEQYSQLVAEVKMEVENAVNNDLPKLIGNKVVSLVKKNLQKRANFIRVIYWDVSNYISHIL